MIECFPLPVKRNKFGEKVKDISIKKYYSQIAEEVAEAHTECINGDTPREAEELVDIMTCCITRLDIIHRYGDGLLFEDYIQDVINESMKFYQAPAYFYTDLTATVMDGYHAAKTGDIISNCGDDILKYFSIQDVDEEIVLGDIIVLCLKRLTNIGYGADARSKLYQEVNEKNRSRGYFKE